MRTNIDRVTLVLARLTLNGALTSHTDNTGLPCRNDGEEHDACYTCNLVEDILRVTQEHLQEIAR